MLGTRLRRAVLGGVAGLAAYALLWPAPIDPVAWSPPVSAGFVPPFERNAALSEVEIWPVGEGYGPETITAGPDGYLYSGLMGGRIVRFRPDAASPPAMETWADTGGRPNGMMFDRRGDLVLTDSWKGLLSISPDRKIQVLATAADGIPFGFPDDLEIASDGSVWFTDGSARFPDGTSQYEALEGSATGRVIQYDPATGEARTRLDGLRFANGIALGPDESYLLVNETLGYRTLRLWLKGPRAGQTEVFRDNYPGFPDNIRFNGRDTFWIALFSERNAALDWLAPHPFARKIVARFGWLLPHSDSRWAADGGFVVGVDTRGRIVHNLQDAERRYLSTTSALEHQGRLYLGSVLMDAVGVMPLPAE